MTVVPAPGAGGRRDGRGGVGGLAEGPVVGAGQRDFGLAMTGDRILLQGLRVYGRHGVLPYEGERGQLFVVDLGIVVDLGPAGRSDDLSRTVDYGPLARAVAELVGGPPRKLLEAVAEGIANLVLKDQRVHEVRVRIAKPQVLLGVDATVAVEITRDRATWDGRA